MENTKTALTANEIREAFDINELTEKELDKIRGAVEGSLTYETIIEFITKMLESISGEEHSRIVQIAYVVYMAYASGYVSGVKAVKETEIEVFNKLFTPTQQANE